MHDTPPSVSPLSRLATSPARGGGKCKPVPGFPPPFTGEVRPKGGEGGCVTFQDRGYYVRVEQKPHRLWDWLDQKILRRLLIEIFRHIGKDLGDSMFRLELADRFKAQPARFPMRHRLPV